MVNSSRPVIMCWVLRSRSYSEVETGADPFELLLAALGACTAMTTRMYANRKGLRLGRVNVRDETCPVCARRRDGDRATHPWVRKRSIRSGTRPMSPAGSWISCRRAGPGRGRYRSGTRCATWCDSASIIHRPMSASTQQAIATR